jgi:Tol biopolymer transport system component
MALAPGTRLGPYEIVGPLGSGGMGEVYRARDTRLVREVAIKVLPEALSSDQERLRRFEKEARSASALNHPNIVTIHDIGSEGGVSYIAMELVEGVTLREPMASGPLPIKKLLQIAPQIAEGLARAHEAGIVHRDLKPENVMVKKDGLVKILDFGLAKLSSTGSGSGEVSQLPTMTGTQPGVVVGTVGYMSPEQASGQPVDFRSDQFSFGSILYEMATGKRAFQKKTAIDTLAAILNEEPEPIAAVNPQTPTPLRWIVERCLAKEHRQRYASTEDLARDLASVRDHISEVSSTTVSAAAGAGALHRRVALPILGAVAASLLLIAAGALSDRWLTSRWVKAEVPTFRRLTFRRGNLANFGSARFAPDGQTIVYAAEWDGAPIELFSTRPGSAEGRSLGLAAGTFLWSISSSGEMALGLDRQGAPTLATAPLGGGEPREVLEDILFADWAPDSKSLAVVRADQGKPPHLEFPIGRVLYQSVGYISHPRVSRAGDRIAFIDHPPKWGTSGSVVVVDLAGKAKVLSPGWQAVWGLAWSPKGDEIWFTADDGATPRALRAVSLSGRQRVVARAPGNLVLYDVSPDGRALVNRSEITAETFALAPGQTRERNISWLDRTPLQDLSQDGTAVLLKKRGEGEGVIYLRKTDGSPAVRLGEGDYAKFSPDGKRVLTFTLGPPQKIVLLPTGAGEPRVVPAGGLDLSGNFSWLPDGRQILFSARQANGPLRCYIQDIEGKAAARPVTPEGIAPCVLSSPDGKQILAGNFQSEKGFLCPLDGGPLRNIPGRLPGEEPIQWSADGLSIYAWKSDGLKGDRVYRIELGTGRRQLWREFEPADLAGVGRGGINTIRVTRDGKSYAYGYERALETLYLVEGLR